MKSLLKLEEAAIYLFSLYLFNITDYSWGWYFLLILTPDISMLGYLFNKRYGAMIYNLFHHRALAISILGIGWYFETSWVVLCGIILFSHASLDRVFGYGFKYPDDFKHTHLQEIQ